MQRASTCYRRTESQLVIGAPGLPTRLPVVPPTILCSKRQSLDCTNRFPSAFCSSSAPTHFSRTLELKEG